MRKLLLTLVLSACLLSAGAAVASAEGSAQLLPKLRLPNSVALAVSGEVRIRGEMRNNITPADGDDIGEWVHMRTRLRADLDVSDNLTGVVELQDVRTLGGEGGTTAILAGVDLKRGEIIIRNIGGAPLTLEAGRMVLSYGNDRIIGNLEWVDQGRTYDGLKLSVSKKSFFVDLFGMRIRDSRVAWGNDSAGDREFLALYAGARELPAKTQIEFYAILLRDEATTTGESNSGNALFGTFGGRLDTNPGPVDFTAELATQAGRLNGEDLMAWAFAVKGGFTADAPVKPRIGFEVDYASGDEDPGDGESEQFQHMFPTNHMHYGYADLVGWSNIWDLRGNFAIKPTENLLFTCDYHNFRLASTSGGWIDAGGNTLQAGDVSARHHLGDEIDLLVKWKAMKGLSFLGGWSYFWAGDFVKDTVGFYRDVQFGYLQGRLKF